MTRTDIVVLIGSPKARKSTSMMLADYLLQQLQLAGKTSRTFFSEALYQSEAKTAELAALIEQAEIFIVAFPLYVDHLPAPLIKVLESLQQLRQKAQTTPRLLTIINCGFPENIHNQAAAEVLSHFARVSNFSWAGALSFGQGGTISGKALEKMGGMVRNQRRALDQAAAALLSGTEITPAIRELMSRKMMPNWFYHKVANWGWRQAARRNKISKTIADRPY